MTTPILGVVSRFLLTGGPGRPTVGLDRLVDDPRLLVPCRSSPPAFGNLGGATCAR